MHCGSQDRLTPTPHDLTAEASAASADPVVMPSANTGQEPSRVLVVEPHPTLRTVLVQRLRQDGHLTAAVASAAEALEVCQEQSPDLLVSAELLERSSALRLAEQLRCPVIVLTARTGACLLYTSPSPRDLSTSRMPSSA